MLIKVNFLNLFVTVLSLPLDIKRPSTNWSLVPYTSYSQYPRVHAPSVRQLLFPWDQTQLHTFECPPGGGGSFPHGEDCSKYYVCSDDGRVSCKRLYFAFVNSIWVKLILAMPLHNKTILATRRVWVSCRNVLWSSIWCLWSSVLECHELWDTRKRDLFPGLETVQNTLFPGI